MRGCSVGTECLFCKMGRVVGVTLLVVVADQRGHKDTTEMRAEMWFRW